MVVRRMRPKDVSAIHTIHTECRTRSLRERYSDEQLAAWPSGRTPEGYIRARACFDAQLARALVVDGVLRMARLRHPRKTVFWSEDVNFENLPAGMRMG